MQKITDYLCGQKDRLCTVTTTSKIAAAVIFISLPFIGAWIGYVHAPVKTVYVDRVVVQEKNQDTPLPTPPQPVTFVCSNEKQIEATFTDSAVTLSYNEASTVTLPQAISASGARYANADESIIFWNKGDTAFMEEAGETTFKDCVLEKIVPVL